MVRVRGVFMGRERMVEVRRVFRGHMVRVGGVFRGKGVHMVRVGGVFRGGGEVGEHMVKVRKVFREHMMIFRSVFWRHMIRFRGVGYIIIFF